MQGIIVVGYPFMKPATTDIQVCETVKSIRPINVINNYFSDFLGKNKLCFSTYNCMLCIHFVHLAIVEMLLMAGSNANDQSGEHCSGVTPLHDAAANGHIEVVKLLRAHGASTKLKDNNVSLLFHWCSA